LERNGKSTRIKSVSNVEATINPPEDSLAIHVRRDTKEYPFFEQMISWAGNCYGIKFGEISNNQENDVSSYFFNTIDSISDMYKSLDVDSRNHIIANLLSIDFKAKDIKIKQYPIITTKNKTYILIEEERVGTFYIRNLSQGMYRTLYILIFIEHLSTKKEPQTIIIDDLCEGLDYSRATKLGKLLFDFCKTHNIQLITSSNDGFLMDVIDLEYWNVLQRDGKKVSAINYTNSKELFDGFKFTGLSNFDFFSSDYIEQHRR
jgi:hypothetical protein